MTRVEYSASARVQFGVLHSWHRALISLDLRTGVLKVAGRKVDLRGADVTHSRRGTSIVTHTARRPQIFTLVPACARVSWRALASALTLAAGSPPGYRVIERLGDGGSGRVYAAVVDEREREQVGGRSRVALKLVPCVLADDVAAEVNMAHVSVSGRVVQPFRVFLTRTHLVSVMELVEGGNLLDLCHSASNGLEMSRIRAIVCQLLEALQALHEIGIAHRDIKLENALLDASGSLRLCDFGLAEKVPTNGFIRAVGTPYTQAPEVGTARYGLPADIWSVGVVLLVLLLRAVPFSPANRDAVIAKMRSVAASGGDPICVVIGSRRREKLPELLLDLLRGLLKVDQEERLDVDEALDHEWFKQKDIDPRPLSFGAVIDVKVRLRRLVEQMRERAACNEDKNSENGRDSVEVKMLSIDTLIDIKLRIRRIVNELRERKANSEDNGALTPCSSAHVSRTITCGSTSSRTQNACKPSARIRTWIKIIRASWSRGSRRLRQRRKLHARLHHSHRTDQPT